MWARRWRDRASARTDQEGGRQQRRRMVRVRQHQENMWLGGLRRDRAVDQQESHTERPHRRHDRDMTRCCRARAARDRGGRAGQFSSGSLLFSQPALAAVDIPPRPRGSSFRPAGAAAPPPQKLGSGTRRKTPKTAPGRRVHLCANWTTRAGDRRSAVHHVVRRRNETTSSRL